MSFNVEHCILCEQFRSESREKSSILGFFGILSNARIRVASADTPLEFLTFVLTIPTVKTACDAVLAARVLAPDGTRVVDYENALLHLDVGNDARIAFRFAETKFPTAGTYTFSVQDGERKVFESTFVVRFMAPANPTTPG